MEVHAFDSARDKNAVVRIWNEIGWVDASDDRQVEGMGHFLACGQGWVSRIDGEAECYVLTSPGTFRYQDCELPFSAVASVTTSRIARMQGHASRLTAHAIAEAAAGGAAVSGLSMFEQGFYDKLGFGTGAYDHMVAVNPKHLNVEPARRPPKRLTTDDWEAIHESRRQRRVVHGCISLDSALHTRGELVLSQNGFGLGYFDEDGELTHHIWVWTSEVEHGPYYAGRPVFRTREQFLELMGLIRNLGDQVLRVNIWEPPGYQLQDLVSSPFHQEASTRESKFATGNRASAVYQTRICDLEACLRETHLKCGALAFNLKLSDPIEKYLDDDATWRGVSGEYTVELGEESRISTGTREGLPTLDTTVNAFTRMWMGVRPATGLAATDQLVGDEELLEGLDEAFCLPAPLPDWEF